MIRVSELSKRYGETQALSGLSFTLERGEILGLLGPNGAGKTTTLRILTGFMPPDSGSVELGGQDLAEIGPELRRRTGYLPETNPLHTGLSVGESLDFYAGLYGLGGAGLMNAKDRVMESCGLAGKAEQPIHTLSKGYRQRLGLAQALLHDPDIIFLDEPTAGLDPVNVSELRGLIRGFGGSKTVILSTHILSEVEAVCDRVLILDRGRQVLAGSIAEIERRGGARYTLRAEFPGGQPDWSMAPGVERAELIEDGAPATWRLTLGDLDGASATLAAWLHESGGRLHELRAQRTGLEEVFLEVVMGKARA